MRIAKNKSILSCSNSKVVSLSLPFSHFIHLNVYLKEPPKNLISQLNYRSSLCKYYIPVDRKRKEIEVGGEGVEGKDGTKTVVEKKGMTIGKETFKMIL